MPPYDSRKDTDNDGIADVSDNCRLIKNANQLDSDGDSIGDACDNCAITANYDQTDSNNDGVGDSCTTTPVGPTCGNQNATFEQIDPDVFIVLDRSGSMSGTKWTDAVSALDTIADDLFDEARFGLSLYPAPDNSNICNTARNLVMGSHTAAVIKASYRTYPGGTVTPSGGSTPTGEAIEAVNVNNWHSDATDPLSAQREKAVILITDGSTFCGGHASARDQRAELAHTRWRQDLCHWFWHRRQRHSAHRLRKRRRHRPRRATGSLAPTTRRTMPPSWVTVIRGIVNSTISCSYQVDTTTNPATGPFSPDKIWVSTKVNGQTKQLSRANGEFTYNATTKVVTITGANCNALKANPTTSTVDIKLGCATPCVPSPEVCDYIDNNCNGQIDELQSCLGCFPELCDGLDNDCDGVIDNGCPIPSCIPSPEICGDGIDNDCDMMTDEGCGMVCIPTAEICGDGKDNDCDMLIDEGCPPPATCIPEAEKCDGVDNDCDGVIDEGCPTTMCIPEAEKCDGKDNNCDGQIDEGCAPLCIPENEICDGLDNDCDGQIDEMCVQCPEGRRAEICDGKDNNCDGVVDEGCNKVCVPENEICDGKDNNCKRPDR